MDLIPEHIQHLIDKYVKNQCTYIEIEELREWLKSKESQQHLEQYLTQEVEFPKTEDFASKSTEKSLNQVWQVLYQKIGEQNRNPSKRTFWIRNNTSSNRTNWSFLRVAASVILLAGVMSIYLWDNLFSEEQTQVAVKPNIDWVTKSAVSGQKLILTLPDGSKVKLNSRSTITFQKDFLNDSIRLVQLDGEAFFEVVESNTPFVVRSGNAETRVLGTQFNVKKSADNNVKVALLSGRVSVQNHEQQMLLMPNEMALISNNEIAKKIYDPKKELGWREGILHLEGDDFSQISDQLEAWYGIEITVIGEIKQKGFDKYYNNTPLKRVLEGLSFIADFDYEIQGDNKVLIKVKNSL